MTVLLGVARAAGASAASIATLMAFVGACAPASSDPGPRTPSQAARREGSVLKYLPLVHDTVLSYDTTVESTGERGRLMMQVQRPRDGRADLTVGGKVQRLEYSDDAVRYVGGGTVLKTPLEVGATWRGNVGTVRITRTDAALSTPVAELRGCVETLEESLQGATAQRITTLFCPDVGIAQLVIEAVTPSGGDVETATLRAYDKRVDVYQLDESHEVDSPAP